MNYTNLPQSDSESDDQAFDENANQPLLHTSNQTNDSTTAIDLSTAEATKNQNVLIKFNNLANIKFNRTEYRRSHREKWSRIHIGVFTVSLLSVIYLCFMLNLNDDKHSPQIIVAVPPIDQSLETPTESAVDDFHQNVIPFNPTKSFEFHNGNATNISTVYPKIRFTTTQNTTLPSQNTTSPSSVDHTVPAGFLVWSPGCQMPDMDPLAKDVMKLFRREKYETCAASDPITRIEMNWTTSEATLVLNYTPAWYSIVKSTCCYSEITRSGSGKNADTQFKLSSCTPFTESIKLPATIEYIFVKCTSMGKEVYKNTHAVIRERPDIRKRLNDFKERTKNQRPLSVLMLSIDSISRLNLIRAMPKTAQHFYDSGWFELQGYDKIDDNTYPNLMGIMTGYNNTLAYDECQPRTVGKLDQCPFIWYDFKNSGYVTSYGEDEASISSFNYQKKGFLKQPTDYYLRPYMLAAEKFLHIKRKHSLTFCLGFKHSADHVYDHALDFATHYKNDASFGLYWTNTFSHNDISDPSSMDRKMRSYLDTLETRGILNESMVVFFSDHSIRFGPVRHLITGWLEERLPFIFIWLPEWFRNEHPEFVQALKINRNRLTNPYDLHMTLQHVMQLSNPDRVYKQTPSCANCQSLFTEVPWNRTCEDSAIPTHWCTCAPYQIHDKNEKLVKNAAQFAIDDMNRSLKNFTHDDGKHPLCAELKLKTISYSRKAEYRTGNDPYDDYIIVFQTSPSDGWFESTVRYRLASHQFETTSSVSRLNTYGSQSKCMKIDHFRKYCYCTGSSNPKNSKG